MLPRLPPEVATNTPPIVVGANGELSPERSKAILKAVDRRSGGSELLKKHLSIEEEITDFPLVIGNRVTLLQDGPATYKAMHVAIRAARDHINLETYTESARIDVVAWNRRSLASRIREGAARIWEFWL